MNKTYALDGVQAILSYPFKTVGWQSKFLIGVALVFASYIIPIVPGIFITGYFAKIMRATIVENAEPILPEWEDWGNLFSRGFKVTCAAIIYLLPAIVLIVGGYLVIYIPLILSGFSSHGSTTSSMLGVSMAGSIAGLLMIVIGFIIYIPLALMLPPAITHLVAKDSFAAAFRIGEWWAILRANIGGFFTAAAIIIGIYSILFTVVYMLYFTIIFCILMPIGLSILTLYLSVVSAPLLGEAYRKGVENLAPAPAA